MAKTPSNPLTKFRSVPAPVPPTAWPPGDLARLSRAVRREHWSAQAVIITAAVAVAYLIFIGGLLVGAGIAPWVAAALGG